MNRITKLALSAVFAVSTMAVPGCYQITQPALPEVSGFLPQHELLEKQPAKFPFQLFYLKKNSRTHQNVYVAPVNVDYLRASKNWARFDQQLAGKLGQDMQKLADFMRNEYSKALIECKKTNKPNVVDNPNMKNTAIIETAIVAIVPTKAELNALGLAGNLLLPGISVVVGRAAAGSVTVECKIRDAETREIIAMYSTTVKDQAAILNLKALSWYGSAQRSIEKLAKYTATVFATKDYSNIKRDFPVKLITW